MSSIRVSVQSLTVCSIVWSCRTMAPYSFLDGYSLLPVVDASSHDTLARRPSHVAAMAACDSLNAGQFMLRQVLTCSILHS